MEIKELLKNEGEYTFDVNEWGSCQYSSALAMYKAYFKLRETYSKEKILEYLKYKYNYEITFSNIRDDEQARNMLFKLYANSRKWDFDEDIRYTDYDKYEKMDRRDKDLILNMARIQSADDMFFVGRSHSSDLWNTAPKVAKSYFTGFETKNLPNSDNPTGLERGPIGNICAQSDNVLTGICCALLVDYGIVKNTNSFKSFDT